MWPMSSNTAHTLHVGRSWWPAHPIEDECPCPKAPCGLVPIASADPSCDQHAPARAKSLRELHAAAHCQDRVEGTGPYAPASAP